MAHHGTRVEMRRHGYVVSQDAPRMGLQLPMWWVGTWAEDGWVEGRGGIEEGPQQISKVNLSY